MSTPPDLRTALEAIQSQLITAAADGHSLDRCAAELSDVGMRTTDALVAEFTALIERSESNAA